MTTRKKSSGNSLFQPATFAILMLPLMIIMAVILCSISGTAPSAGRGTEIEKAISTQGAIISSLMEYARVTGGGCVKVVTDRVDRDQACSMSAARTELGLLRDAAAREKWLMIVAEAIVITHIIIYYAYFIYDYRKKRGEGPAGGGQVF
jgi:hypothetical protein